MYSMGNIISYHIYHYADTLKHNHTRLQYFARTCVSCTYVCIRFLACIVVVLLV